MVLAIASAIFLAGCLSGGGQATPNPSFQPSTLPNIFPQNFSKACFENGFCLHLEVADTQEKRSRGLMFRESAPRDAGMLFVFDEEGKHDFWMKNTLVSLDIAWLDENYLVVDALRMAPCRQDPCQIYEPEAAAKYAIEAAEGVLEENKLEKGGKLRVEYAG